MKLAEIKKRIAEHKDTEPECHEHYEFDDIKTLLDMLDEAKGVIEWYGEIGHWGRSTASEDTQIDPCDWEEISCLDDEYHSTRGGKRARELLKKWEK